MFAKSILVALLNACLLVEAGVVPRDVVRPRGVVRPRQDDASCLSEDTIQSASALSGQDADEPNEEQADSLTDEANFINFCSGKTITDGLQVTEGSCNGVVMGDIPSTGNMVSIVITSPEHNEIIQPLQDFDISLKVANFQPGSFTNPSNTYYSAPQQLNNAGNIIGHVHVTVQDLGNSMNPTDTLDPTSFAFFKGINDDGDGNGLLTASVTGGLPAGNYRACSIVAAANHQPVLMPVAQRGAQDDCQKFVVSADPAEDVEVAEDDEDVEAEEEEDDEAEEVEAAEDAEDDEAEEEENAEPIEAEEEEDDEAEEVEAEEEENAEPIEAEEEEDAEPVEAEEEEDAAEAEETDDGGVEPEDAVGGITPPEVVVDEEDEEEPFKVGDQKFSLLQAVAEEACKEQKEMCLDAASSRRKGVTSSKCRKQARVCTRRLTRKLERVLSRQLARISSKQSK